MHSLSQELLQKNRSIEIKYDYGTIFGRRANIFDSTRTSPVYHNKLIFKTLPSDTLKYQISICIVI